MAVSYSSLPSIYFSTIILSVSRLHCQRFFLYVDSHILPNINIKERTAPFQTLAGTKFTLIYSPMYSRTNSLTLALRWYLITITPTWIRTVGHSLLLYKMGKPLRTYTTPEKSTKYECNYDALLLGNTVKIAERSVVEGGKWTWTEEGWEGILLNNPFLRDFWTLYKKPSPITSSNSFLGAHLLTSCCLHDVEPKNQVIEMLHFDWSCHEPTPITTYLSIIYSSISNLYIYIYTFI